MSHEWWKKLEIGGDLELLAKSAIDAKQRCDEAEQALCDAETLAESACKALRNAAESLYSPEQIALALIADDTLDELSEMADDADNGDDRPAYREMHAMLTAVYRGERSIRELAELYRSQDTYVREGCPESMREAIGYLVGRGALAP
jgi:hypothetical protein